MRGQMFWPWIMCRERAPWERNNKVRRDAKRRPGMWWSRVWERTVLCYSVLCCCTALRYAMLCCVMLRCEGAGLGWAGLGFGGMKIIATVDENRNVSGQQWAKPISMATQRQYVVSVYVWESRVDTEGMMDWLKSMPVYLEEVLLVWFESVWSLVLLLTPVVASFESISRVSRWSQRALLGLGCVEWWGWYWRRWLWWWWWRIWWIMVDGGARQ